MITKETVFEFIYNKKQYLKDHFHIEKIGVFGSFSRNEQSEISDIDLIVEFEENTPDIYDLKNELRSLFKREFGMNVDIAREKYLKSYAKDQILSEVIYVE